MVTTARVRAVKAAYYVANRDAIKARVREYQASNPEKVAAYRAANRDKRNAQRRAWGESHKDELRAYKSGWDERNGDRVRSASRDHYAAHAEQQRAKSREWRQANPDKHQAQQRRYRVENADKVYAKNAKRRARLRGAHIENVSPLVVFVRDGGKCGICRDSVARKDFTLDHIVPLSRGGEHSYRNVQTAHRRCNSSKGAAIQAA